MCGTYVYHHTYKGKKLVTTKTKCLRKKKGKKTVQKKNKLQKNSVYFSEFSKFVVLDSNFSLYINFFTLRVTENCRNIHRVSICSVWSISR